MLKIVYLFIPINLINLKFKFVVFSREIRIKNTLIIAIPYLTILLWWSFRSNPKTLNNQIPTLLLDSHFSVIFSSRSTNKSLSLHFFSLIYYNFSFYQLHFCEPNLFYLFSTLFFQMSIYF